ncbi:A-kinase anchor protein 1, mitochondrial isoform X2 [Colius striatus]|uniref:A-kinase anchor protein 1, mitochondrial isoform X2 n=1 Tax=Colius striatus TaxID=57412 RepID=UPI002B1D7AAF|nr:A-kinase anchor protein 1, mitochondrial isoform X2 [Colius striatus]
MALRFRSLIPYAVPGVLALLGCWWIYSRRKKHAGYASEPAAAIGEEQQKERTENDSLLGTEVCVPQRLPLSSEECLKNEASTSLLSAGSMTPSLLRQTRERPDLSEDLPDVSVMTIQPSILEDDSEKLETIESQDESSVPACVSLPLISKSLIESSGSSANQDQWPSASMTLAQEYLGIPEEISNAEQSGDSSFKPPEESQMPEMVPSDTGCVTTLCLGLEKEASNPQAFLNSEVQVLSRPRGSSVSMLPDSLEQSRKEESIASTLPRCQEEDMQPKRDELEREKIGGVNLNKEEFGKIEQVAIQIISRVILAATGEVLSGAASDVPTQICQAAATQVETPLEMASGGSTDRVLAEEAAGTAKSGAAGLPSPQTEGWAQNVAASSCSAHSQLSLPAQGHRRDHQGKSRVRGEELPPAASDAPARICQAAAARVDAPLEVASGGSSEQVLAEEAAGTDEDTAKRGAVGLPSPQTEGWDQGVAASSCSAHSRLSLPAQGHGRDDRGKSRVRGQHLDSLSLSATQDVSAEQSPVPSENPSALKLPEDRQVPYSNGTMKEDGPDVCHECPRATGMDGEHSEGLEENSVDFVDTGSAMRKTVSRQNSKLRGESSKSDSIIWEIEVPKELVGRLIGKQGRFMSTLRQASGAKIYVSTLPYFRDSQVCHIEGSPQQVEKVLSLIGRKFKELCLTNVYAVPPPAPLTLHSLLMTAWLFLPDGVTVEVVVANQVDAGHMFLQQHTHPTFHVLRSLDQQMFACYSQPEIPTLPTPVEVGIICAAPGLDGAWLRAQVISYFEETSEVELRYVDYGGYDKVKVDTLRQIRSDFLSLPFQGAEVLLDNVVPLPDEDHFSPEADAAVTEMTRGAVLVAQVTNYDTATGLPLIQLWNLMGDEVVSINRTLVERGFAQWLDY